MPEFYRDEAGLYLVTPSGTVKLGSSPNELRSLSDAIKLEAAALIADPDVRRRLLMSDLAERIIAAINRQDTEQAIQLVARLDAKFEVEQAKRHAREQYFLTQQRAS